MTNVTTRTRTWRTPSGKPRKAYVVAWYDAAGKRQRKQFKTAAAQAAQCRALEQAPAPEAQAVDHLLVRGAGERWVRYVELVLKRSRSTWSHYEQQLRDHLYPATIERDGIACVFGDLSIASITAPDCEKLKDALIKKLDAKMAARMMTVLRMLFNDVMRLGDITTGNPASAAKVKVIDRGEGEIQIPQEDQARRLIEAVRTAEPLAPSFTKVWTTVTTFSGLRPSENRGLAIEDLALEGLTPGLTVNRSADEWRQLGPVKTKNARRFIPLPPVAVSLLKRWLLVVPRKKVDKRGNLMWDGVADPDPKQRGRRLHLVFPTEDATVQTLANIYNRCWLPAMIHAGLYDMVPALDDTGEPLRDDEGRPLERARAFFHINSLRHLYASLQIAEGLDPETLKRRMGHSSIKITYDHYGHLFAKRATSADDITRIAERLLG